MGFIGIDRNIKDHWIYKDPEHFKIWFEILLRARFSHVPEKVLIGGQFVTVEYGQFIYGRQRWSEELRISEQRLRTLFAKLQADGMIEIAEKGAKYTLYSVTNYAKYNQLGNQQINQQESLERQGFEETSNQQINQDSTGNQPASNQHLTGIQPHNNKEIKKEGFKDLKDSTATTASVEFDYDRLMLGYQEVASSSNDPPAEPEPEPEPPPNAFKFYEQNIGMLPKHVWDEMQRWLADFDHDVIVYALQICVEKNLARWSSAVTILSGWFNQNARTLAECEALEAEFRRRKAAQQAQQQSRGNGYRGSRNAERKPAIPMIADTPQEPMSEEELAEMRRLARKLDGKGEAMP